LKRGFQFNVICVGTFTSPCQLHDTRRAYPRLEPSIAIVLWFANFCPPISRSNWSWKVDPDQHHVCVAPHRLQRSHDAR
jgi:hypothetical protein